MTYTTYRLNNITDNS